MTVNAEEIDQLALRVQRGEQDAFWEIILRVEQDLRIFISVIAPSSELVEEILQASFLRCHQVIGRYEPRGTFMPWIKGIARNILQEELRARTRHLALENQRLEAAVAESCLEDAQAQPDDSPGDDPRLRECIEAMAPHSKDLLERRYARRLSLKQIAQQIRKPAASIAVALFRIREALRQCLQSKGLHA